MTGLINANPTVYEKKERRIRPEVREVEDEYSADAIDQLEVFDHIRDIKDPEHPYSLEELKVITEDSVEIDDKRNHIRVTFTPTVEHCSMATVIGLCLRVKLLRSLPSRFKAFINAWNQACSTKRSVLLVPEGRRYLVNATRFEGSCAKSLTIMVAGTIVAPDEPAAWDPKLSRMWLNFHNLTGVSFRGTGVIDGSGSKWWAASCKKNKSIPCKGAPTALTISSSTAIKVRGLKIQNSQQMHFVISRSDSVRVSNVQVSAPGDSPNTDGIHISESTNVVLQNCKIGTGDDCVSIVNASSNIKMKTIYCGPGHGISIGSLGKDNSTAVVTNVVLSGAFIRDATNGLRIKTWQGGSGYVKAIRFENVRMESVANPIIIDQFYCDSPNTCLNQTSAVEISQVMYRNISGTTKSKQAMKFACSDTVPCSNIILDNVNLDMEDGTPEVYCNSATGIGYGPIHPSADCLITSSGKKDLDPIQVRSAELEDSMEEKLIHTDL